MFEISRIGRNTSPLKATDQPGITELFHSSLAGTVDSITFQNPVGYVHSHSWFIHPLISVH